MTLTAFSNSVFFAIKILKWALWLMVRYEADRGKDILSIVVGPPMTLTAFSNNCFFSITILKYACVGQTKVHSKHRWRTSNNADCIFKQLFFCHHNFEVRAAVNGTICGGQTQRHSHHRQRTSDDTD